MRGLRIFMCDQACEQTRLQPVPRNRNCRLRLLCDSSACALRAWDTLGRRPNPPRDFAP